MVIETYEIYFAYSPRFCIVTVSLQSALGLDSA
jgi:hypothetical protein